MRNLAALLLVVACGAKPEPAKTTPTPPPDHAATPTAEPSPVAAAKAAKAIAQPQLLPKALPNDPARVTIHRLSNGMTVYLSPDPQEPTIVAHVVVHAGSSYDPEQSTGLAHYLEHMLFKGTTKLGTLDYAKEKPHLDRIAELYADLRKPGADRDKILKDIDAETLATSAFAVPNELDKLYDQMGITGLNAFTNNDETVYVSEIPKNRVEQWARVEASRYADAVFRLFWPEIEAVYEEKNRALDNPGRRTFEAFMRALFPHHGYGWSSTLGEVEHLKSPAYGDMVAFYNRYYTPQNMAIVLSGDVDESVLPILEREFATFTRPPGDAPDPGQLSALHGRSQVDVPVPSREGVVIGWPLVSATGADRIPLEVMDLLLYDGRAGLLKTDLLLPQKVANATASPTFLRDGGFYQLTADALSGQTHDELEKLLLALVAKLQRGEFSDDDIQAAILNAEILQQRQLESNGGRERMIEQSFIDNIEWADEVAHVDRLKKVTKADVIRVAKQYLTGDMIVVRKVKGEANAPKITKPGITPFPTDASRATPFRKSILAMAVRPIEPASLAAGTDYVRGKLATGPIVAVKNARNGLFSITYSFDYGRRDDRLACFALDVMRVSGAGKLSAAELTNRLHALGLTVDTFCSKDQSSITIAGIDRNMAAGLELLRQWMTEPALDATTLAATVKSTETERDNQKQSPQSKQRAQMEYATLGDASNFLVQPSNKQLETASAAQVKKLIGAYLHRTSRTSYFGPRELADVQPAIALGDGNVKLPPPPPLAYRAPNTVIATDDDTAVQTQVWVYWPRAPVSDADRAAGQVFTRYAAPLVYQEVREARGLAYTVFAGFNTGARKRDASATLAYVGTQGDKTDDAIPALLDTLARPLDDTRIAEARKAIEEEHRVDRIAPRFIASSVYDWDDQGEPGDPRDARTKRALAIDKPALEKWVKSALGGKKIVAIFGNRKKLDDKKLAKLAPITWVPIAKLFAY